MSGMCERTHLCCYVHAYAASTRQALLSERPWTAHCRQDASTAGIFYIDDKTGKADTDHIKTLLLLHGFPSASYDFVGTWDSLKPL